MVGFSFKEQNLNSYNTDVRGDFLGSIVKYILLFIWLTVSMYYYYEIFPRTILWFIVSIPIEVLGCLLIIWLFEKNKTTK